jgi:hypothetical protein
MESSHVVFSENIKRTQKLSIKITSSYKSIILYVIQYIRHQYWSTLVVLYYWFLCQESLFFCHQVLRSMFKQVNWVSIHIKKIKNKKKKS